MTDRALSLLSIAVKAGKVVSGGFMSERTICDGTAHFVIIAGDASDNTKKKFINKCSYYNVPYRIYSTSEILGRQIGKGPRTTVTVTDEGFAKQIIGKIDSSKEMEV